jgi:hypothetical protein
MRLPIPGAPAHPIAVTVRLVRHHTSQRAAGAARRDTNSWPCADLRFGERQIEIVTASSCFAQRLSGLTGRRNETGFRHWTEPDMLESMRRAYWAVKLVLIEL